MRVVVAAALLTMWFVQPVWAERHETWAPHPALAEARAQALMLPKLPIEDPGAPKSFGMTEGVGVNAPVPGTGQGPRFFGQAPFPTRQEAPAAPAGGAPAGTPTTQ
jgi:hypothetical protein